MNILDKIWEKSNICKERYGRNPEYVMMHPKKERELAKNVEKYTNLDQLMSYPLRVFGLIVCPTDAIDEEEIIVFFDPVKTES